MYIAAVALKHGGVGIPAGSPVPAAALADWTPRAIEDALRLHTIMFLPPQLLEIPGAEVGTDPEPVAKTRAAKAARKAG